MNSSDTCNLNVNQSIITQPSHIQPQIHFNNNNEINKLNNFSHQPSSSTIGSQSLIHTTQQINKKVQPKVNSNTNYRKVFIQRDYSEGTSVRFQNKFPEELEGYIERQHFDYLISTLNCYYDKAEATNPSTFCEGFCACISAYLIYICMETHYEKYMRKVKEYINEQNDKVWKPRGLLVTDPIDRGLRIIEITIGPKAQKRDVIGDQLKGE